MTDFKDFAIDTERLTLRVPRVEDFEESRAMWGDPAVVRYVGNRPFTREECWARVLRYIGHWAALGFGFWTVREKATGRFVGDVGFGDFHREIEPPFGGAKEMGWVLNTGFHGKGYATEAVHAALAWAERRFGPERLVAMIDLDNAGSVNVAKKAGFREYTLGLYKGEKVRLFERVPGAR